MRTIDEVLNKIVGPTKGLVTACVGRPCALTSFVVSSSAYTWDEIATPLEVGLSDQVVSPSAIYLHPNEILVRTTDFTFAEVVPRWFELCDTRSVATHFLWSDRYGKIEYPEMRIQTVATAAEALHAARVPGLRVSIPVGLVADALRMNVPADQMKLIEQRLEHLNEPSLRERLRHLFNSVETVLPPSFASTRGRWINAVVDARNDIAHGNDDRAPASAGLAMTEMLAEIIELSLLLEAGIGSSPLADRLWKTSRFRWLIEIHDRYVKTIMNKPKESPS